MSTNRRYGLQLQLRGTIFWCRPLSECRSQFTLRILQLVEKLASLDMSVVDNSIMEVVQHLVAHVARSRGITVQSLDDLLPTDEDSRNRLLSVVWALLR